MRLTLLSALLAVTAVAQPPIEERVARIERGLRLGNVIAGQPPRTFEIGERLRYHKVPGVSVAVLDGGRIVFARGYGFADAASRQPVTAETLFQAASISKPIAAMVAMRLVEQGKLALDEDIAPRLKSWKLPANPVLEKEKVTLRRLLSHTAGLTVHGFRGYAQGEPVPTLTQVLLGEAPANSKPVVADLVPGSRWRYSGGGYEVAQLLIEEATGKPFAEVARELVLQPLGMARSTYAQPLPEDLRSRAATGFRPTGTPVEGLWHTYPEQAAAGLWTTPSELLRAALEMQSGGTLLKPASVASMLKPVLDDYGIGFSLRSTGGQPSFSHGGANEGFRCQLFAYVEGGRGVAVMTNSDRGDRLAAEILRAVAAEFNWPDFKPTVRTAVDVPAATLAAYAGRYAFTRGPLVTVTHEGGKLFVDSIVTGRLELVAESSTKFFVLEGGLPPLIFAAREDGSATLTTMGETIDRKPLQ